MSNSEIIGLFYGDWQRQSLLNHLISACVWWTWTVIKQKCVYGPLTQAGCRIFNVWRRWQTDSWLAASQQSATSIFTYCVLAGSPLYVCCVWLWFVDIVALAFCSLQLDGDTMFLGMPEPGLDFASTNQVCVYETVCVRSFVCRDRVCPVKLFVWLSAFKSHWAVL